MEMIILPRTNWMTVKIVPADLLCFQKNFVKERVHIRMIRFFRQFDDLGFL